LSRATETVRAQGGAHGRDIAQEQLILQVLGAGRDDGLAAPQQRRHQVGEGLAGARAGLGHEHLLVGDGLGHGLGHLGLRLARLERADGGCERAAGAEQAIDVGVVLAGGSLGFRCCGSNSLYRIRRSRKLVGQNTWFRWAWE
jgi:hypothetical protein